MIISKHCNTMGKYNNIFDNITKLLEAGLLSSKDLKKEIENFLFFRIKTLINKLNLPSREEITVLSKRLEKLEKKFYKKKSNKKRKS